MMKGWSKKNCEIFILLSEYLLAILVILECNSVYKVMIVRGGNGTFFLQIGMISVGIVLLTLWCILDKSNIKVIFNASILLNIILYCGILFLIVNITHVPYNMRNFTIQFLAFLPIYIVLFKIYANIGDQYRIFFRISDVVLILSILSLLFWFAAVVFNVTSPIGKVLIDWGGNNYVDNYYNFLFVTPWQKEKIGFLNTVLVRNTGIFPESPMYNIVLILALYTELFLNKKFSWCKVVIYVITIFSTCGTIGVMLLAVGLFLKYCDGIQDVKKSRFLIVAASVVLLSGLLFLIINKKLNASGSFSTRIDDVIAGLKTWRIAPIFGTGFDNYAVIQSNMSEFRSGNLGFSNSFAAVAAQGGLFLLTLYLVPIGVILKQYFTSKKSISYWGVGIFGLFVTTIFQYCLIMILFLAFGYSMINLGENNIDKKIKHTIAKEDRIFEFREWLKVFVLLLCFLIQNMNWFSLVALKLLRCFDIGAGTIIMANLLISTICIALIVIPKELVLKKVKMKFRYLHSICNAATALSIVYMLFLIIKNDLFSFLRTNMVLFRLGIQDVQWRFIILIIFCIFSLMFLLWIVENTKYVGLVMTGLAVVVSGIMSVHFYTLKIGPIARGVQEAYGYVEKSQKSGVIADEIYISDFPYLYQQVPYAPNIKGGIPQKETKDETIVIADKQLERPELLKMGFLCGSLEDAGYVYIKGKESEKFAQSEGIILNNYYDGIFNVDLHQIAAFNNLELTSDGILIKGKDQSIIYGPYETVFGGQVEVIYDLQLMDSNITEGELAKVRVSKDNGKTILVEKELRREDFQQDGMCQVKMAYTAGDSKNVEFLLFANDQVQLKLTSIKYHKTGPLK